MPEEEGRAKQRGWSAQQRLEFIEFRLRWQGTLNRSDLRKQFGISEPQASADLAAYQELAPGNCEYDRSAKQYVVGEAFEPVLGRSDPQVYLHELRSVAHGITPRDKSWIGRLPPFATIPLLQPTIDETVLVNVLEGIASGTALQLLDQSLSANRPTPQWMTPHAFGYDGHGWYVRAFCHVKRAFSDFPLGHLSQFIDFMFHEVDPKLDREWQEEVTLEFGPHPELPTDQIAAVELDHQMVEGRLELSVRSALVPYVLRWMRIEDGASEAGPSRPKIILLNREQVEADRDALRAESAKLIEEADIAPIPSDPYVEDPAS